MKIDEELTPLSPNMTCALRAQNHIRSQALRMQLREDPFQDRDQIRRVVLRRLARVECMPEDVLFSGWRRVLLRAGGLAARLGRG